PDFTTLLRGVDGLVSKFSDLSDSRKKLRKKHLQALLNQKREEVKMMIEKYECISDPEQVEKRIKEVFEEATQSVTSVGLTYDHPTLKIGTHRAKWKFQESKYLVGPLLKKLTDQNESDEKRPL